MELNRVKKDKNYADLLHNSLKKQVLKTKAPSWFFPFGDNL